MTNKQLARVSRSLSIEVCPFCEGKMYLLIGKRKYARCVNKKCKFRGLVIKVLQGEMI
jgi:hypothetical protein